MRPQSQQLIALALLLAGSSKEDVAAPSVRDEARTPGGQVQPEPRAGGDVAERWRAPGGLMLGS